MNNKNVKKYIKPNYELCTQLNDVCRIIFHNLMIRITETIPNNLGFGIYSIVRVSDGKKEDICYEIEGDSYDFAEDFDIKKCICKMRGSFIWRGSWDQRLWFPDEEYYGEELEQLHNIYKDIEIICRNYLRERELTCYE